MRSLVVLGVLGAAAPARAEHRDIVITGAMNLEIGALTVGPVHGFVAPGLHLDAGAAYGPLRLQAEAEWMIWNLPEEKHQGMMAPTPPALASEGSMRRFGLAAHLVVWDLPVWGADCVDYTCSDRVRGHMNVYVETGVGREHIEAPSEAAILGIDRTDVMFGFGLQPLIRPGASRAALGGTFGMRVLVAEPPDAVTARLICRGSCPNPTDGTARRADVALLFVLGLVFGR